MPVPPCHPWCRTAMWILVWILILSGADARNVRAAQVRIRLVDWGSGEITPAMVCVTDGKGRVRLPPDGRILSQPSSTEEFYRGVEFQSDPNWIGPVRKMQGRGDNNDRSYVYDLLPSIPYWSEPVLYQTSGEFTMELEEGEYRLAVEHGMEFIPRVETVRVEGPGPVGVELELRRWINLPEMGWWSGDVHVHHPTLQKGQRDFLLHYARAADLHVVNVLEMGHHQGTDFKQLGFGRDFRVQEGDYALASGQEEPRSTFGHIIGLNTTRLVRDVATYDLYDIAFHGIHQQTGALVGFAHFSWNGCDLPRGFPWYVTTEELDFVELLQFGRLNAAGYHDYLNMGFRLTAAAGSDTPWGSTIGEVRTYVHTGGQLDLDAWFENLGKGRTFVSNGPFIQLTADDKELPGSELVRRAGETVRFSVRVQSHPSVGVIQKVSLVGNEGVLRETGRRENQQDAVMSHSLQVKESQWVAASVVCENGALAHTTPIYIVVDGRPPWSAVRGPGLVRQQLDAIALIEREVNPPRDQRQREIRTRLDRARRYYGALLELMQGAR